MSSRPATFDHLKSAKKPLRRTITIFLDDDPVVALAQAQEAYHEAVQKAMPHGLDEAEKTELLEAITTAQQAVEATSVQMTFESIGRKKYDRLVQLYPPTEAQKKEFAQEYGEGKEPPYDADAFAVALIAASCITPRMTEDEVAELRDSWNTAEYVELFTTALEVNTQRRVADLGNVYG